MKIEIDIPEGYEIDTENSTKECIKLKKSANRLPKSWEEFCETHPRKKGEAWIDKKSKIETVLFSAGNNRAFIEDKNMLPNKEFAEAMLALCQLIQLRDCYNDGWIPNYQDKKDKYCIIIVRGKISGYCYNGIQNVLTFKTPELRNKFIENFKYLIEIAKPLL